MSSSSARKCGPEVCSARHERSRPLPLIRAPRSAIARALDKRRSARDLSPAFAGTRGYAVKIFGHHVPVDHDGLSGSGRNSVSDIGAADGECAADDDAEDEAHLWTPLPSLAVSA